MPVKPETAILGVDDAPFSFENQTTQIIGCVLKGNRVEGVLSDTIVVDGIDATEKIASMLLSSEHHTHIGAILLDGITFGGFNVVDIDKLAEKTNKPVVAVMKNQPDYRALKKAMKNVDKYDKRVNTIEKAGDIHTFENGRLYFQCSGISPSNASDFIRTALEQGKIPEPVRVAHLIAAGIKKERPKQDNDAVPE